MALPYTPGYGYNPYQFGQMNPLQPQMDRLAQMQAQYQQPQQSQQVNQGILWVQGEAGAKSYLVAPNTSVLLMDTVNNGFRDVIEAQNAGTQRIIDLFTQDKIQSLQTELQSAQLQLSNNTQTSKINAQIDSIINVLRPIPVPSYPVMSPYTSIINPTGFSFGGGCGCNTGCGC